MRNIFLAGVAFAVMGFSSQDMFVLEGTAYSPPLYYWDFNANQSLPSWITFTRSAATATYFDATGTLQTAGANVARFDHDIGTGVAEGLLLEETRTNVVLNNRDLTNVTWSATNITPLKDRTGIDGVASSASSLTATSAGGTITATTTASNAARFQTAYVKCITCTGNIQMTQDNSTFTTLSASNCFATNLMGGAGTAPNTNGWVRCQIPVQTLTNPTVGFKIANNSDEIAVDFVQNENGSNATSPIAVAGAGVARNIDLAATNGAVLTLLKTITWSAVAEVTLNNILGGRVISGTSRSSPLQGRNTTTCGASLTPGVTIFATYGDGAVAPGMVRMGISGSSSPQSRILVCNGGAMSQDASAIFVGTSTNIWLGSDNGLDPSLNGWFSKIGIYTQSLSSLQLQRKTAAAAPF